MGGGGGGVVSINGYIIQSFVLLFIRIPSCNEESHMQIYSESTVQNDASSKSVNK